MRAKVYEVRDLVTDQLIITGTCKECAEKIGMHRDSVRQIAVGGWANKKYKIIELEPALKTDKKVQVKKNISPAARWDEFCDPIRKRFGIQAHSSEGGS